MLLLPILFSLKCDNTVGNDVPWLALWTPMWIVDGFLLVATGLLFTQGSDPNDTESPHVSIAEKISHLFTTLMFILVQIFMLMRLDGKVTWSWGATFAPWYIYEVYTAAVLVPSALFENIPLPNLDEVHVDTHEVEDGHNPEEELLFKKVEVECEYFNKAINQRKERRSIAVCALRLWLAAFLAVQLDRAVAWNWGLVLLPVWLYLLLQLVFACHMRAWGLEVAQGVDVEALAREAEAGGSGDPVDEARLRAAGAMGADATSGCLGQCAPLLMAVLLVSRLQV